MIYLPDVVFRMRFGDEEPEEGGCPIGGDWVYKTTHQLFADKRVIIFSLPGAFTPTCSTYQVPGFEEGYECFQAEGIDEIYCVSVNDAFVMNAWAEKLGVKNVKMLPDGNGEFSDGLGMLVDKSNLGFGARSWRYAMIVDNLLIEKMFVEEGLADNVPVDPYGESSPENVMNYLRPKG